MKSTTVIGLTLFLAGAVLLNACSAKDRNTSFQQGQGENLLNISDYDGKTFDIQTKALKEVPADNNAKAEIRNKDIKISLDQETTQSFPLVEYTTTAKLLSQVPLHGRPNWKYQALYKVTDNFLKVYQVGAKADIDKDQQTYAEHLPDGRLAVPLIGYPIKGFFNVAKIKNSDNEETNKLGEFSKERDQAQQFRFDINAGQLFEAALKDNHLPANYFTGEWYFAATIIAAAEEKQGDVGYDLGFDQDLEVASRIKFSVTENLLKAQNLNVDDRLNKKDDVNLPTALAIPVKWRDYETAPKGRDKDLREREITNKNWNQKQFIELDFDQTQSYIDENKSNILAADAKLTGLDVSDNYFSYTLQLHKEKVRIRYSFLRVTKSDYKPKKYFYEDSKLFGFKSTNKALLLNYEIQSRTDLEKNTFISRFNPSKKQIVYHFTKSSPGWVRPAARQAIQAWDRAFASIGSPLRIILDESFDVDLGDLRYNAINLIESLSAQIDYSGYGPSISDTLTGEIISATSNIHISNIRDLLVIELRHFISSQLGLISPDYSVGLSQISTNLSGIHSSLNSETGSLKMEGNFSHRTMKLPSKLSKYKSIELKNATKHGSREKNLAVPVGNIHEDIKNKCPEILAYIETLKKQNVFHNEQEVSVFRSCSAKLTLPKIEASLLHELGHNFGLRHNYMGSVDKPNYWNTSVTGTTLPIKSSSVMDYLSVAQERLNIPGAYDLAALRYGYTDSVLLKNNNAILKLDPNQSISKNLGSQLMRPYQYCTDEDLMTGGNPLCFQFDVGSDPIEIVNNLIHEYYTSMSLTNQRFDHYKANLPLEIALYRNEAFLLPMKRIYEEWRLLLMKYVGHDRRYLEGFDEVSYKALLDKIDPKNPAETKDTVLPPVVQYKRAAQLISKFLKTIAMLPNHYCVTEEKNGKRDLVELDFIRQSLFSESGISSRSCADTSIQNFVSDKSNKQKTILGYTGYFLNDVRYDLDPLKTTEPLDVIGSLFDRFFASAMLSSRENQSSRLQELNFSPAILDEPNFRANWTSALESRLLDGVDTKGLRIKNILNAEQSKIETALPDRIPLFRSEKTLLLAQFSLLLEGLTVPENADETQIRKIRYSGTITPFASTDEESLSLALSNGTYFIALKDKNIPEKAAFSVHLVEEYNKAKSAKTFSSSQLTDFQVAVDFINSNVPSKETVDNYTVTPFLDLMAKMEKLKFPSPAIENLFWSQIMKNEKHIYQLILGVVKADEDQIAELNNIKDDKAAEETAKKIQETEKHLKKTLAYKLKIPYEIEKRPFEFSREQILERLTSPIATMNNDYGDKKSELSEKLDTLFSLMPLLVK